MICLLKKTQILLTFPSIKGQSKLTKGLNTNVSSNQLDIKSMDGQAKSESRTNL